jgi:transcriptional regulator with XRE-family HTH domain
MPRPLKNVPPDTLGGKIRAARQALRYSLADVAGNEYSTSLISQIERNKIEPSSESLKYLAERLHMPLEELEVLAQKQKETEAEVNKYKEYEDLRAVAAQLLQTKRPKTALEYLKNIPLARVPLYLRWRLVALRGQCFFSIRQFLPAQQDFLTAVAMLPDTIPSEHFLEVITLRLHLAAATREVGQYLLAYDRYQEALKIMDSTTPLNYIAEAHWGISLVLFELANQLINDSEGQKSVEKFQTYMEQARDHAEKARTLYQSIGEILRVALLNCQLALIEQATGNFSAAKNLLRIVLDEWEPTLEGETDNEAVHEKTKRYSKKERANVVSAAACYLASLEHEQKGCQEEALKLIDIALKAGLNSYIVRRADAYITKAQILAESSPHDAIEAYRQALRELAPTDRLHAKIRVHELLGEYLIKLGQVDDGEKELEMVRKLASLPSKFTTAETDEDPPNNA